MLVSLNKNTWLYVWMRDNWNAQLHEIMARDAQMTPRPSTLKKEIAKLLTENGYKAKALSNGNIVINIKDDEFMFLALKYMGE